MANEELKQALGDDLCDYCPWKSGEIDPVAIVFARAYIVMMRWTLSWMKTKVSLMMMRNN